MYVISELYPKTAFSVSVPEQKYVKETATGRTFVQVKCVDTSIPDPAGQSVTGWTGDVVSGTDIQRTYYWEQLTQTFIVKDENDNVYAEVTNL